MIRLKEQYTQAVSFRKRGFTYAEIAKVTGVSKSTVAHWLSHETWSATVKEKNQKHAARENSKRISLLNKARANQYARLYTEAERSAKTEFKHYKRDPLFMAGLMLYVGAGDRTDRRRIRVSSADMEIHRVFIAFATEYLGVSRETIRFWLLLSPTLNEQNCVATWSDTLGITSANFYKNQRVQGARDTYTLQHGVGNTIIGSAVLKRRLMTWIELALKEF